MIRQAATPYIHPKKIYILLLFKFIIFLESLGTQFQSLSCLTVFLFKINKWNQVLKETCIYHNFFLNIGFIHLKQSWSPFLGVWSSLLCLARCSPNLLRLWEIISAFTASSEVWDHDRMSWPAERLFLAERLWSELLSQWLTLRFLVLPDTLLVGKSSFSGNIPHMKCLPGYKYLLASQAKVEPLIPPDTRLWEGLSTFVCFVKWTRASGGGHLEGQWFWRSLFEPEKLCVDPKCCC